jgi:hypothetical protein
MRRIFLLSLSIVLGLIFGFGLTAGDQKRPVAVDKLSSNQEVFHLGIVDQMISQVRRDRVLADLRRLTGEEPICTLNGCHTIQNRLTGTEGLKWAKDYIDAQLVSLGYTVEVRDWSQPGLADQNLIVRKPGRISPGEEVYFVAHLDGVLPEGAIRSPAADDDASGAAALLELARILSRYTFQRTVVLFFSTGEEQGARGVRSYVSQLSSAELNAIQYVVSVEMLSYDEDQDGVMQLWSGDHPPSLVFAQMLSEIITTYPLNLSPRVVTGCT